MLTDLKARLRKRGADTAQMLLWALATLVLFSGGMMLYSEVNFRKHKENSMKTMFLVSSEIRKLQKSGVASAELWNRIVGDDSPLPNDLRTPLGPSMPYGGTLAFMNSGSTNLFQLVVMFNDEEENMQRLCNSLSANTQPTTVINHGPLGDNYIVASQCNAAYPVINVIYQ